MTHKEAVALAKTDWWKGKTAREIVGFQLYEKRLCMPFDLFHAAIEEALGRPVFTHEFGLNVDGLKAEFEDKRGPAGLGEIIQQLVDTGKTVIIMRQEEQPHG